MSVAASVDGDDRLRLFFALPLPVRDAEALAAWAAGALRGAHHVRVLPAEQLHITLAFLGSRAATELPALRSALHIVAKEARRPVLTPCRYRETQRVAMVAFDDDGGRARALQERLSRELVALGGYRAERRSWLPHVTVARFRLRPGLRASPPALGAISPSEVALYHSVLRPGGAQYQIVEAAALGG